MKYELMENGVVKIYLDNGKVNALSTELSNEVIKALEKAEKEAKAVVICGNPGIFSAGFDLKVVAQGLDVSTEMLLKGLELIEKIYQYPKPLVIACEGHAVGMGIFLLLAADYKVGANGKFTLKLPETEISMGFAPILKLIAKTHIDKLHHAQAIVQSRAYDPVTASQIGMLDEICSPEHVIARAVEKAVELSTLPPEQYAENKRYMRADEIAFIAENRGL